MTPTTRLPPCAARSWFASCAALPVAWFTPMENVNAPCTGWPSAEMTRHVVTYVPLPSFGTVTVTVAAESAWLGLPVTMRWPPESNSRIPPRPTWTFSSNRSEIVAGDRG